LGFSGSGCAPGKGEVSGKVTYNGAPLDKPGGNIVFVSPAGEQVVAPIAADGSYRATDVPRGEAKVAVYYPNPKFQEAAKMPRSLPKGNEPMTASPLLDIKPFITPDKYASTDKSGLVVKVEANTTFNTDLTGPPIK
jgi:hypothetical protein